MKVAETYRAREVYRYYQPTRLSLRSTPTDIESLSTGDLPTSTNFTTQRSFSDTALTAFAQLIALRLESQRAIVSLIDHENEYFLAESTSTFSLLGDGSANASLSISGARCPREASLCEQTLLLEPNSDALATPIYLVEDLRLDDKMSTLDCVKGAPYLRFYCGVNLTNTQGVRLGCVYVVDDRPRSAQDFTLEQAQFLHVMAATIMDHLENIRAREDVVRMTMMSQALHAFVEGDGSMRGDWQRMKRVNLPSGGGVGFHWQSKDKTTQIENDVKGLAAPSTKSPGQKDIFEARFNFNNSPWSSTSDIPQASFMGSGSDAADLAPENGKDSEFSNDGFSELLRTTFGRASNLIREGMEVDGAVFFDAPYKYYQGRSTLETDPRRMESARDSSDSQSRDDNSEGEELLAAHRPGPRPFAPRSRTSRHTNSYSEHVSNVPTSTETSRESDILGYSTAANPWNHKTASPKNFKPIDQSLLTSLVRRYPQGALFVFDKDGPIPLPLSSPSAADSQATVTLASEEKLLRHEARKRAEINRLLLSFPGAFQIFFVPLLDATSGCYIGSFAWSTSPTRIFSTDNHLSYLAAFGHSVMAEISRLNTLSADRAKGDFISNVSHELRSPLHGILASIEFLAETELDGFQRNLVDTVDICGRTLLDTIEHVLDFSKIKKFGQESMQPLGVIADLDISAVIEEVVEGVNAGFAFNGLSSEGLADATVSSPRHGSRLKASKQFKTAAGLECRISNDALTVILDIDFKDSWKFPTVPGMWRRLTMNVFGNALKYTQYGFVKVKLGAKSIPQTNLSSPGNCPKKTMISMTVTDSGQGMSSEFMKTKLFTPFSQEDVTVPGTGLGMSIVKQIVDLAGGEVQVRSQIGTGTEVKISIPLENCLAEETASAPSPQLDNLPEDDVAVVCRRARGKRVTIRGFESVPGDSAVRRASLASLKASIVKYITKWLLLTITSDEQTADIVISDEAAFLESTNCPGTTFKPLLILCENGARHDIYNSQLGTDRIIEFVSTPFGPHRIAKGLLNCLDAEDLVPTNLQDFVGMIAQDVSSPEGHDRVETTGKSKRLIGKLQSSIEFSRKSSVTKCSRDYNKPRPVRRPSLGPKHSSDLTSTTGRKESSSIAPSSPTGTPLSDLTCISRSPSTRKPSFSAVTEMSVKATIRKPKMLLVEDNPVNMMLLSTYMKKNGWEFEKAANGLLALQAFQKRPEGFDVVFMDVSMPIMDGFEATREIRALETERRYEYEVQEQVQLQTCPGSPSFPFHLPSPNSTAPNSPFFPRGSTSSPTCASSLPEVLDVLVGAPKFKLNRPALIIALTGFSSQKDQEMAFESGVDIFMTKPVRFKEVGRILDGWIKSFEFAGGLGDVLEKKAVVEVVAQEIIGEKLETF